LTTDLSDESVRAFAPVNELALESGAEVTLLHVVDDVPVPPAGAPLAPPLHAPDLEATAAEARERLGNERERLSPEIEATIDVKISTDPARAIAEAAEEHGADLIAISTHGRTGFRRLVLGSVTEGVVRHAHVPVLVFPRH
ncbi:MAG: universal stress protein, partial [Planctomycetota bacterium]